MTCLDWYKIGTVDNGARKLTIAIALEICLLTAQNARRQHDEVED